MNDVVGMGFFLYNWSIAADISYYFGTYRENGMLPLIQIIQLYEGQDAIYFGYVLWDTSIIQNMEYVEDGEDYVNRCEKYELKGQKAVLDIDGKDTDLTSISLSPDKIANSLTDFLIKQKVIKNRRNSCVEFWGKDQNGKYVLYLNQYMSGGKIEDAL